MKGAVLFDLGNTLVRMWQRTEYPGLLDQALGQVRAQAEALGLPLPSAEVIGSRATEEDYELADHRVRPLYQRLARVYDLAPDAATDETSAADALCRAFLRPMLARCQCYPDTKPVLRRLRELGVRTAIVSNTPWGSPGDLWREELDRMGLSDLVDAVVFCTDAGWRKPARQVFDYALVKLAVRAEDAVFVGDHFRWDVEGARCMGMEAVLIDRWAPTGSGRDGFGDLDQAVRSLVML